MGMWGALTVTLVFAASAVASASAGVDAETPEDAPAQESNSGTMEVFAEVMVDAREGLGSGPSPLGTITVSGTVKARDDNGNPRVLPNAIVRIYDDDVVRLTEKNSGTTDDSGIYSISVDNCDLCDGLGSGPIDLRVGVQSDGPYLSVKTTSNVLYEEQTANLGEFPDGSQVTVNPQLESAAFRVLHHIRDARWKHNHETGESPPKVRVYWPECTGDPHHHPGGFNNHDLGVPENCSGWGETSKSNDVLRHEYGHFLMWWGHGSQDLTAACNGNPYHLANTAGCALAEGWATFSSLLVDENPIFTYPSGTTIDFESTDGYTDWDFSWQVPFRVAAAFWDLWDGPSDGPDDPELFSNSYSGRIWPTVKSQQGNFEEYYGDWQLNGYPLKNFVSAAGRNTIDFDYVYPTASVVQPVPGCTYVLGVPSCGGGSGILIIGTSFTVKYKGTDNVGLWKVEIYIDGDLRKQEIDIQSDSTREYNWEFELGEYGSSHTIKARVVDWTKREHYHEIGAVTVEEPP